MPKNVCFKRHFTGLSGIQFSAPKNVLLESAKSAQEFGL